MSIYIKMDRCFSCGIEQLCVVYTESYKEFLFKNPSAVQYKDF